MNTIKNSFVEGPRSPLDQAPMSVNVFSDYTFRKGRLKGFSFGLGMQYRGRIVIGNRGGDTIVNPANPLTAIDDPTVDAFTPIYAKPRREVKMTLGYNLRLKNDLPVNFRLRIDNLLNTQAPYYNGTILRPRNNDYTSPARETVPGNLIVIRNPISFNLSAEVKL
jgi:hypothetical protein